MNERVELVALEDIKENPFQMRLEEDPEAVREVAISIARHGLLQKPAVREIGGGCELVFGHTRLAAYRLLAMNGVPEAGIEENFGEYGRMPVEIHEEVSDRQMFEVALAENVKRRDLNPIEVAKALRRYMDEFKATSEEAGELFGLQASTVRGKVRLLDLPEGVQEKIASRELPEGAARQLLTLQRVKPDAVIQVGDAVVEGQDVERVVERVLDSDNKVVGMWGRYDRGEAKAGKGLWPLNAKKFPALPEWDSKKLASALEMPKTKGSQVLVEEWVDTLKMGLGITALPLLEQEGEKVERLAHLLDPPVCNVCPYYAKANGYHYCGFKACHERKAEAWMEKTIQEASKRLKIAVYDKEEDGADKSFLVTWQGDHEKDFKARHKDVRLILDSSASYNTRFDGVPEGVKVVYVGEKAKKIKEKQAKEREGVSKPSEWEKRRKKLNEREGIAERFLWEKAAPIFSQALDGIESIGLLESLYEVLEDNLYYFDVPEVQPAKNATSKIKLAHLKQGIVYTFMVMDVEDDDRLLADDFMAQIAKHLRGIAKAWGVKLPATWLKDAKAYQQSVAAETEGKDE